MISFEPKLNLEECSLSIAGGDIVRNALFLEKGTYRLVCVKNGNGKVLCLGNSAEIRTNDLIFALPDADVEFICEQGRELAVNVVAFSSVSGKYTEVFDSTLNDVCKKIKIFTNENISPLLDNVSSELADEKNNYSTELLSLICRQLLVYLYRSFSSDSSQNGEDEINVKVCSKIMSYIDEHVYDMKNLREVSRMIGYNYSYVSTLFHNTCGITLNSYFKTKRMNEAKKLLTDSKMSISEIARVMNYSSVYAFSKAFKEHFGTSPGYYSGRFINRD